MVVTGIQPAVAITLIELGITFSGVLSAMDLESGLEKLKQELGNEHDIPILCKDN